jgi:hypothetical protein
MNAWKTWLLVVGALVTAAAVFVLTSQAVARWCTGRLVNPQDDLDWLRREFRLGAEEMARIRDLHAGYLPRCQAWCAQIAAKKTELAAELAAQGALTPRAEALLRDVAALRAQCQADMLRHFVEVSRAMPPEQGRRYLAEMQRLTLGFHEQTERAMTPAGHTGHAHP